MMRKKLRLMREVAEDKIAVFHLPLRIGMKTMIAMALTQMMTRKEKVMKMKRMNMNLN